MSTLWVIECDQCGKQDTWDVVEDFDIRIDHVNVEPTTMQDMIKAARDPGGKLREFYGWVCTEESDLCGTCAEKAN